MTVIVSSPGLVANGSTPGDRGGLPRRALSAVSSLAAALPFCPSASSWSSARDLAYLHGKSQRVSTPCNNTVDASADGACTGLPPPGSGEKAMTVYARPGTEGSLMSFASRYDNYIGGEWVPPMKGDASRTRRRSPARRSARLPAPTKPTSRRPSTPRTPRRPRGVRLAGRAGGDPQQDRRPHRGEPRVASLSPRPGTTANPSGRP